MLRTEQTFNNRSNFKDCDIGGRPWFNWPKWGSPPISRQQRVHFPRRAIQASHGLIRDQGHRLRIASIRACQWCCFILSPVHRGYSSTIALGPTVPKDRGVSRTAKSRYAKGFGSQSKIGARFHSRLKQPRTVRGRQIHDFSGINKACPLDSVFSASGVSAFHRSDVHCAALLGHNHHAVPFWCDVN